MTGSVRALVFDVFGTVVDWRKTVIQEGIALGSAKGKQIAWEEFADRWRVEGYVRGVDDVSAGKLPWMNADELHRRKLDELLIEYGLELNEAEAAHFNRVWHRLEPFPDAVVGLEQLRQRYTIAPLSNGNVSLLTNMAKRADIRWDCILSGELFKKYKPDPQVYLGGARLLGLEASETMLVASHTSDLEGARRAGLATAFVGRPHQWGIGGPLEPKPSDAFDVVAVDFIDLADKLLTIRVPAFR
ncbi:haloacid dehalogenase type II [Aminobacter sp. Piv2-1]|uniref:haloacid dehalogenase type II n=1 Tax=Aminobacter sp. Piv2-1 TaxID=3031122 RepID=UPI0030A9BE37